MARTVQHDYNQVLDVSVQSTGHGTEVFFDRCVEIDRSFFDELEDRGRDEGFRDRGHVEQAPGGKRLAGLETPYSQGSQVDDLPSPGDRRRQAGDFMGRHRFREEVVERFLEARGLGSFGAARCKEQEDQGGSHRDSLSRVFPGLVRQSALRGGGLPPKRRQ